MQSSLMISSTEAYYRFVGNCVFWRLEKIIYFMTWRCRPPTFRARFCRKLCDLYASIKKTTIQESVTHFLRATAVPAGTAEARISYGDSVCPSVRHNPVPNQAQVR